MTARSSPLAAAARLAGRRGRVLLHSARNDDGLGTRSFVAADPSATLIARGRSLVRLDRSGSEVEHFTADPLVAAEAFLREHGCTLNRALTASAAAPEPRVIGYLGYDLARVVENLPHRPALGSGPPDLWLSAYDAVARWDHDGAEPTFIGPRSPELADAIAPGRPTDDNANRAPQFAALVPDDPGSHHVARVEQIRALLAAGDVYQVNLARRHVARIVRPGDPLALYTALAAVAPAPYGALLEADGATVISGSPERFLASCRARIETRPIKGTRAKVPGSDRELRNAEKDSAEHLMIVDLERNDLGRIAQLGTVRVDTAPYIVELPALYHMVSRISALPRPEVGYATLLRATFPGGSITGAPKVRAMQIIDELEPAQRGPYCGAVGYFGPTGFELAIAIRIGVIADDELRVHVGGGIVADSDPAAELAETELKARGWIEALAQMTKESSST